MSAARKVLALIGVRALVPVSKDAVSMSLRQLWKLVIDLARINEERCFGLFFVFLRMNV